MLLKLASAAAKKIKHDAHINEFDWLKEINFASQLVESNASLQEITSTPHHRSPIESSVVRKIFVLSVV